MSSECSSVSLDELGVLRVRGAQVVSFLQGQVSNDVALLGPGRSLLAGYHNPQGRVIALLRLVQAAADDVLAILPRELAAPAASRLPEILLALAVAAGEPQVCAATSEEFVAQMLNLDVLGAIAFDKGCYTGQEVIARAHYRGRVKRRLQRFVTNAPLQLRPGDAGALSDGRAFKVVSAVALADRRCEFLAVAPFAGEDSAAGRPQPGAEHVIDAQQLPLPYSLPP